jgi:Response regulator containing CheY-like receiver, AAA-type ATPase, and DNA-binding domains
MFSNKENANASKILVVDDEQDIVTIIGKVLKKNGYEVTTANDGLECIDKVSEELPDLVLLDNIMPNMGGQAVLAKLKASKKTADIPVIMVTALADQEHITGAQKGGAVEYIIKPFDYTVLLEKIAQVLKSKQKRKVLIYR